MPGGAAAQRQHDLLRVRLLPALGEPRHERAVQGVDPDQGLVDDRGGLAGVRVEGVEVRGERGRALVPGDQQGVVTDRGIGLAGDLQAAAAREEPGRERGAAQEGAAAQRRRVVEGSRQARPGWWCGSHGVSRPHAVVRTCRRSAAEAPVSRAPGIGVRRTAPDECMRLHRERNSGNRGVDETYRRRGRAPGERSRDGPADPAERAGLTGVRSGAAGLSGAGRSCGAAARPPAAGAPSPALPDRRCGAAAAPPPAPPGRASAGAPW